MVVVEAAVFAAAFATVAVVGGTVVAAAVGVAATVGPDTPVASSARSPATRPPSP